MQTMDGGDDASAGESCRQPPVDLGREGPAAAWDQASARATSRPAPPALSEVRAHTDVWRSQMKPLRRTVLVVVTLLVVAGVVAFLGIDGILKRKVEEQATASLKLDTTLNSARLSLFGGKVNLNRLRIASPQGFSAPHMLELGDIDLAVRYGQLRK